MVSTPNSVTMEEASNPKLLQEWAPLTYITQQIKPEVRTGFSSVKQSLSCIDFTDTHIVLGSDFGFVYWCPRSGLKPRELRIQGVGTPITAIRIGVGGQEFNWIATGDKLGSINVFQISTNHSSKDRMYYIPKHHKVAVTTLEWNDTGDTLYSGDEMGIVKTCELLFNKTSLVGNKQLIDEQYKIVQLSFKRPNLLLVSSLHRAVIVKDFTRRNPSIHRIGKKARTSLIPLGAVLIGPESEPVVIAARPRQRLWIADTSGDVLKTLIFTNLISEQCPKIPLVNSAVHFSNSNDLSTVEFSRIEKLNSYLVVLHNHGILILDIDSVSVIASLSGLRDLKSVAVHSDEIMFLEGNFSIVRLGWEPDPYQSRISGNTLDSKLPVAEALTDISTRLKDSALRFVPILTATFQGAMRSLDQVTEADEAAELPPIISVDGIAPLCIDRSSPTVRSVQPHEFENIALAQRRIRNRKSVKRNQNLKIISGVDSGSDDISTTSAFSELTSDGELSRHPSLTNMAPEDNIPHDFSREPYVPLDIKPDLRSQEDIRADVASKEKILEESLHLDDVISSFTKKGISLNHGAANDNNENSILSPAHDYEVRRGNISSSDAVVQGIIPSSSSSGAPLDLLSVDPSTPGSSSPILDCLQPNKEPYLARSNSYQEDGTISAFGGLLSWNSMEAPDSLKWFCVSEKFLLIGGKKMNVYAMDRREKTCSWEKLDYNTSQMFMSPKGSLIWKLDVRVAYELKNNDLFSCKWETVSRNVTSISLNDVMAWYICDNQLYMQSALNSSPSTSLPAIHVPSQLQLIVVSCYKLFVWVLSEGSQVQRREGISKDCLIGNAWVDVVTPEKIQVKNILVGPNFSGWIISSYNNFYFTKDCSENVPVWFQLLVVDPISVLRDPLAYLIDRTLWIADSDSRSLYYSDSALEGEEWVQLCEGRWKLVSAGGIFVDYGSLWLYSDSGRLYQTYPHSCSVMQEISPPNDLDILCLGALSEVLWLLLTNGDIYIREGISNDCFAGKSWKPLDMQQISKKVTFQHLSIGLDSVWAVSKSGSVFVAVGSPFSMSTAVFAPAWVLVESEIVMAKVFVGPELHMVWAIDRRKNVYVRDAIFPDFQIGLSWVLVPGIKANHLSVSSNGVWAVSSDRQVFRRHGITQNNYIGDYWRRHTNSLSFISVSGDDNVWGIDRRGALVMKRTEIFSASSDSESTSNDNPVEDLWEIIDRGNLPCSADE